jgi:hypothetical protein
MARQAGTPGDLMSLAVGDLLLETDQQLAARTYLKGWIESSSLRDAEMAGYFIGVALDADDPDLAYEGAMSFGISKVAQGDLVALAEALAALRRTAEFDVVRGALEPETIAANPLVAAAAAMRPGGPATATTEALLRQVTVSELDAWRLTLWSQIMRDMGQAATAAAELERMGVAAEPEPAKVDKPVRRSKRSRRVRRPSPVAAAQAKPSVLAGAEKTKSRTAAKVVTRAPAKAPRPTKAAKPAASARPQPKSAQSAGPFEFLFK